MDIDKSKIASKKKKNASGITIKKIEKPPGPGACRQVAPTGQDHVRKDPAYIGQSIANADTAGTSRYTGTHDF